MGVDLTLLPLKGARQIGDESVICIDCLNFDQDYEIFGQIEGFDRGGTQTIKPIPIPPQLWVITYEEEGIKRQRDDKYGKELTFVFAKALKKLKVGDDASPKNKAIKAFVDALPNDTPIILFWC